MRLPLAASPLTARKGASAHTALRVLALLIATVATAYPQTNASIAPINPAFTAYLRARALGQWPMVTAEGRGLGAIPSPVGPISVRQELAPPMFHRAGLPSSYDLRTVTGKLPPVRNQGSAPTCWAFAAYGSLESCLRPAEVWDFSENNMKNTHGFDWAHNYGGNRDMAVAYIARWGGPIDEADDPYNPSSGSSPPGLTPEKHVQDILYLPTRPSGAPDATVDGIIKQAVMDFGAVYTTMYWADADYNSATYAYYHAGGATLNHGVAIVGWDDAFPRSSFKTTPAGDGAFIVRNSWGSGWGQGGYFYLSYYDTRVARDENTVLCSAESPTNYGKVYQYDPLGRIAMTGAGGGETGWEANVFTATYTGEELRAVSTHAAVANTSYELRIYVNPSPEPAGGDPVLTQTGTFTYGGYHTVVLASPVTLQEGDKFSVVFKLTTPGWNYPLPLEYAVPGYSSAATASAGQSYRSANGTSWLDYTLIVPTANFCIKAFTSPGGGPADTVTITDGPSGTPNPVASGGQVQCSVTAQDSLGHALSYQWTARDSQGNAAGSFDDGTAQNPKWTAPANTTDAAVGYTISVTVTCSGGKSATGSYTQTVNPVADAVTITQGPSGSPNPHGFGWAGAVQRHGPG
jgi:C1A family cysteine protease